MTVFIMRYVCRKSLEGFMATLTVNQTGDSGTRRHHTTLESKGSDGGDT